MAYEVIAFVLKDTVANDSIEPVLKEYILDFIVSETGVQKAYWGMEVENPRKVHIFVHWDSIEAHEELQKKDYYLPFIQKLSTITDMTQIHAFHTHVQPHPADQVLHEETSPVTELFTAYFPKDYSEVKQREYVRRLETLVENVKTEGATENPIKGYSGGWAVEDLVVPGTEEKGKAFLAIFGWESVEKHREVAGSDAFKRNRYLIDEVEGLRHRDVVHFTGRRIK